MSYQKLITWCQNQIAENFCVYFYRESGVIQWQFHPPYNKRGTVFQLSFLIISLIRGWLEKIWFNQVLQKPEEYLQRIAHRVSHLDLRSLERQVREKLDKEYQLGLNKDSPDYLVDEKTVLSNGEILQNAYFGKAAKTRVIVLKMHLLLVAVGNSKSPIGIYNYVDLPLELAILDTSQWQAIQSMLGYALHHYPFVSPQPNQEPNAPTETNSASNSQFSNSSLIDQYGKYLDQIETICVELDERFEST